MKTPEQIYDDELKDFESASFYEESLNLIFDYRTSNKPRIGVRFHTKDYSQDNGPIIQSITVNLNTSYLLSQELEQIKTVLNIKEYSLDIKKDKYDDEYFEISCTRTF